MATLFTPIPIDDFDHAHQLPEPVHVYFCPAQAPPSPPLTGKKSAAISSSGSSPDGDRPGSSWRRIPSPLVPSQWLRLTRARSCFVLFVLFMLVCWRRRSIQQDFENIRPKMSMLTKSLGESPVLNGLQFIPANNQHIHVSARSPFLRLSRLMASVCRQVGVHP